MLKLNNLIIYFNTSKMIFWPFGYSGVLDALIWLLLRVPLEELSWFEQDLFASRSVFLSRILPIVWNRLTGVVGVIGDIVIVGVFSLFRAIPRISSNLHPARRPYLPERLYLSALRSIQGGIGLLEITRVFTILFFIIVGFVGLFVVDENVLEGHVLLGLQAARTPAARPWSRGADWARGRKSTTLRCDRQTRLV